MYALIPPLSPGRLVGLGVASGALPVHSRGVPFRSTSRTGAALAGLALILAVARPGAAQTTTDLSEARQLFREALAQEVAGDWAGALAKLEKVARVKLTPQVRYHVARCKEHLGRYTEALGDYRLAEYGAQQVSAPELPEIARARKDLETRVPRLHVVLPDAAAGASVRLDDVELGATQIGVEIPVNPGPHRIVATLGKQHWAKTFTAKERGSSRIDVALAAPHQADGDEPSTVAGTEPVATRDKGAGALPWVAAGVGVAGVIGAGAFYALHAGAESDLDSTCHDSLCPESMRATHDKSKLYGTLTGVSAAVGVVGLGTAAVLWISHSDSPPVKDSARAGVVVDAAIAPGWRGVAVRGSF